MKITKFNILDGLTTGLGLAGAGLFLIGVGAAAAAMRDKAG